MINEDYRGKHNGCCNHAGCWRKATEGVCFGKDVIYFCEEHYEQALEVATK